jgi:hypothetical protein
LEDEQSVSRLKLRTFSIGILLVSATLGLSLNFSEGIIASSDQQFDNKDGINQLRDGFANESAAIQAEGQNQGQDIQVETDFFFLPAVSNVIQSVIGGLGSIITLGNQALSLTGLNVPPAIRNLINIVVLGVVFAALSAYRSFDI